MMMAEGLNSDVLKHIETLEKSWDGYAGVPQIFDEAAVLFETLPAVGQARLVYHLTPKHLGPDLLIAAATLFAHAESRLRVLHLLSCYRLLDLIETIISGLNRGRFTGSVLATRSLVEHAAISKWKQRELAPLLDQLDEIKPSSIRRCKGDATLRDSVFASIVEVDRKLEETYGAGRFDRRVLEDLAELKPIELKPSDPNRQVGVMDAIDELSWTGPLYPATTPRFYYELLCDYVHPNVGSNFLYVNQESHTEIAHLDAGYRNKVLEMEISANASDKSLYLHVLALISIPIREATRDLIEHIRWLESQRNTRAEFQRRLRQINIRSLI